MIKNHLVLILIFSLFFLEACSKEAKTVADPGPNFAFDSLEVKMAKEGPNPTPIHRDEPTSGPQIQIRGLDEKGTVAVERKLVCGPVTLQGKKALSGDSTLMNFRLAEEEFPGLSKMPTIAKCKLMVIVTNTIGSTTTKLMPVTLTFDKGPPFEIVRLVAVPGLNPYSGRFEVTLEGYKIKNTLPYPLNLTFTPRRQVSVKTEITISSGNCNTFPRDFYEIPAFPLVADRIDVSGDVSQQFGNLASEVHVVVPVGGVVNLVSYGQFPAEKTRLAPLAVPTGGAVCRTFKGINVVGVSDPKQTLSVLWGFEPATEDVTTPNYLIFKEDSPVPGISVAPFLNESPLP